LDALLELADLPAELLDLLQKVLARVRGVRRQELQAFPQKVAAPNAEDVTHLEVVEGVLGQGGVQPILELGTLSDEHHPRTAASRAGPVIRRAGSRP